MTRALGIPLTEHQRYVFHLRICLCNGLSCNREKSLQDSVPPRYSGVILFRSIVDKNLLCSSTSRHADRKEAQGLCPRVLIGLEGPPLPDVFRFVPIVMSYTYVPPMMRFLSPAYNCNGYSARLNVRIILRRQQQRQASVLGGSITAHSTLFGGIKEGSSARLSTSTRRRMTLDHGHG